MHCGLSVGLESYSEFTQCFVAVKVSDQRHHSALLIALNIYNIGLVPLHTSIYALIIIALLFVDILTLIVILRQ